MCMRIHIQVPHTGMYTFMRPYIGVHTCMRQYHLCVYENSQPHTGVHNYMRPCEDCKSFCSID
jgi:hypothetical protein